MVLFTSIAIIHETRETLTFHIFRTNSSASQYRHRAAFCPATLENEAACLGRHAGTKTVRAGALQLAGLKCTFHLPGTWIYGGRKSPFKQKGGKGTWRPADCQ